MDFFLGIVLTIVLILIIVNYVSISVSDEGINNYKCNSKNTDMNSTIPNLTNDINLPMPIDSKSNNSITGKFNLQAQMDDYHKQFYLPPY